MVELVRGMRLDLTEHDIVVIMQIDGNANYDYTCFGLDQDGKLSDDSYMIFYNQTASPNGEINYREISGGAEFVLHLSALPTSIDKLSFTVSIDGNGTMSEITAHNFIVKDVATMGLSGTDFAREKAIIAAEIYRYKNGWKLKAVGMGYDGGLSDLLKDFGGEEIRDDLQAESNDLTNRVKISLEKKLEFGAPKLVSLVKPLKVALEKRNLLSTVARVGLVLDISGSMGANYRNGTVQEIVNKVLPIAVQFDDDGELDVWFFGSSPKRMPSANMQNYEHTVPDDWLNLMYNLGGGNDEPKVMREVIEEYKSSKLPAYIIFISDGGIYNTDKIKTLLIKSSHFPMFWQFVGVGGSNYGILENLDTMEGRYVDNAGFFALDDFRKVPNGELYDRLLSEFPHWLKIAKQKKIFTPS